MEPSTQPQEGKEPQFIPMPEKPEKPEKRKAEISDITRQQVVAALQKPEMQVTNEEFKRAEELFRSQTPDTEMSEEDKSLIARVGEFKRLVNMLPEEDRKKLAEQDMKKEEVLRMISEELKKPATEEGATGGEEKVA